MKNISIILIITLFIFGCSPKEQKVTQKIVKSPIREVILGSTADDYDGPDLTLSITETQSLDTITVYKVNSTYKGKVVGFQLEVPNEAGTTQTQLFKLKSIGQASSNFLDLLSDLSKLKHNSKRLFLDSISVAFVNLNDFAKKQFGKEPDNTDSLTDYKLFLDDGTHGNNELELYINISDKGKFVEIQQKESDTWPSVIKLFTKK